MSCSLDDSEDLRAYTIVRRRARKPHHCDACDGDAIRKGDIYEVMSGIDHEWRPFRLKRCLRCSAMFSILNTYLDDDTACHWTLDCGHAWEDNFSSPPPEELVALAFMSPDEAQARFAADRPRNEPFTI